MSVQRGHGKPEIGRRGSRNGPGVLLLLQFRGGTVRGAVVRHSVRVHGGQLGGGELTVFTVVGHTACTGLPNSVTQYYCMSKT